MRTLLLALALSLATAACLPWPKRSPLTDAFSRDLRVALPAIQELGTSDRGEAQSVLMYIARDPDPMRSRAALEALRHRARMEKDQLESTAIGARERITELHEAMESAVRNGNLPAVAAFYADDAVLLGRDGHEVVGRAAIEDYWSRMQGAQDWELTLLDVEGQDGLWIERGRSKLSVLRDEQLLVSEVEFLLVWQQQPDGSLRIKLDAFW